MEVSTLKGPTNNTPAIVKVFIIDCIIFLFLFLLCARFQTSKIGERTRSPTYANNLTAWLFISRRENTSRINNESASKKRLFNTIDICLLFIILLKCTTTDRVYAKPQRSKGWVYIGLGYVIFLF